MLRFTLTRELQLSMLLTIIDVLLLPETIHCIAPAKF
jgi:hypothetical protein